MYYFKLPKNGHCFCNINCDCRCNNEIDSDNDLSPCLHKKKKKKSFQKELEERYKAEDPEVNMLE